MRGGGAPPGDFQGGGIEGGHDSVDTLAMRRTALAPILLRANMKAFGKEEGRSFASQVKGAWVDIGRGIDAYDGGGVFAFGVASTPRSQGASRESPGWRRGRAGGGKGGGGAAPPRIACRGNGRGPRDSRGGGGGRGGGEA